MSLLLYSILHSYNNTCLYKEKNAVYLQSPTEIRENNLSTLLFICDYSGKILGFVSFIFQLSFVLRF